MLLAEMMQHLEDFSSGGFVQLSWSILNILLSQSRQMTS